MSQVREKAERFLHNHKLVALATVSASGIPSAATVYAATDEKLNLYFITRSDTQKFRNIQENPNVSVAVTDEQTAETVQLIGRAETVEDKKEAGKLVQALWKATLDKQSWPAPVVKLNSGDLTLVKITPTQLKYGDFKPLHLADGHEDYFEHVKV